MTLFQRAAMESAGTALLAFTISRAASGQLSSFEQACMIGLTLSLLINLCGRVSGAHFNPAVTLLLQHQRWGWAGLGRGGVWRECFAYGVAQLIGARVGFALDPLAAAPEPLALGGVVPEFAFSIALFALILVWSHEGRICPFAQPLAGVVIGLGLVVLVVLGGLTGSGLYNPAIALALVARGGEGVLPLVAAQLLAALALMVLRPPAGQPAA